VTVLAAHGSDLEREFPFGVVRQLFEPLLVAAAERERLLVDAAAAAGPVFESVHPEAAGGGDVSFAALHGLYWLTVNVAGERPLLLAVDDLQWCDRPSLRFLAYLARRLEGSDVVLTAGLRTGERGTDPVLIGELADAPGTLRLRPGALSEAGVAALIHCRLGAAPEPPFTEACLTATGGNPLLLGQLLASLEADGVAPVAAQVDAVRKVGPGAVSRTVLRRLHGLPAEAAAVAQAVAVLGDGARLALVAALAVLDEDAAARLAAELARVDILRQEPPLGFVHPLVRDAVYHDLPAPERELRHARAAALLRDARAPAEQVAAQLLHTPSRAERWAAELLWEAGRAAMRAGAADSAVAYLRRALDELPADADRAKLLLELGTAEACTKGPAAAEHLALAYEKLSDPETRAAAAGLLGRALIFTGSPDEAASVARRAAKELPDELDDLRKALEALEFMTVFFGASGPERLSRLRAYRRPPEGGPGSHMLTAMAAWEAVCTDGTAAEAAELALAALEGGHLRSADPALIPFAAVVALVVTDRPEAVEVFRQALEDAHRLGSLLSASSIYLWHGFSHLLRGDLVAAEESLRAADDAFVMWGHDSYATANSRSFMAEVLRERGHVAEASRWLEEAGTVRGSTHAAGAWLTARAALLIATDRAEEASAVADELAAHCAAMPDPARLWWRSLKAGALDRLGRREEAVALALDELEVTRAFGAPSSLGRTLRVLGTLERDDGLDRLREAVDVLEGSTARLEHAKALAALGTALRRGRKPTEAREPLRRALELADRCDAKPLAEQARTELHAAGGRPRRSALTGAESLTASERRVAELAAEGRTNKEIAQALFVTLKTVELHLSHAYRKLGIRSRHGLSAALGARP
jgi:DNA-binding CsgD family transcriptional regulator